MGGKPSKRPRPSYEEGELRDKSIEKKQDPNFQPTDLVDLVRKAVSARHPKGQNKPKESQS